MSRAVTLWRGSPPPQALAKCERVIPSSRARWFIRAAKASCEPATRSAKAIAASLPEAMTRPCSRSSTRTCEPTAANMLEPPDSASPSRAARAEIGAGSSSRSRPSATALKTISAVRILVVEAGDIGASAFLANKVAPESKSTSSA